MIRRLSHQLAGRGRIGAALLAGAVALGACTGGTSPAPSGAASAGSPSAAAPSSAAPSAAASSPGGSQAAGACPASPPPGLPAGESRDIAIETAQGNFTITVHGDWSPLAAGNFAALAECGFYTGVGFHRLVPDFVIQGGDPTGTGSGGPGYGIKDEPVTQQYRRGVVAMARTQQPDSQGSQFFVVLTDEAQGSLMSAAFPYALFGEVTTGMETVDKIAAMPNSGPPSNSAVQPVTMDRVTVTTPQE
jgi:peptidyl-prolyl cis-trans isomerase B (cyclophilin B)